ncbi:MAG: hypothetical protein V3V04_08115 [Rhizobiaceae bacterium]
MMRFCLLIAIGLYFHAPAIAQSVKAKPNKEESKQVETTKPDDKAVKEKQTEEQKPHPLTGLSKDDLAELDDLLLGAWVFITDNPKENPSLSSLTKALGRCLKPAKIKKLDIEPGAERKFPEANSLVGDLVYYQTKKGLQRFTFNDGQLTLLTKARKLDKPNGRAVWAILGRAGGHMLQFANAKKRGGNGQLLLENKNLYLRCKFDRKKKKSTDQ